MENKEHWKEFYAAKKLTTKPSSFTQFVFPYLKGGELIELGCGNCRDLNYFKSNGIQATGIDEALGTKVEDYIRQNRSPKYVYTRFFWHAIPTHTQYQILDWAEKYIFIEARTTEDENKLKHFKPHLRNYVNVSKLVVELKSFGYEIVHLEEGIGFSPFKEEDPHLVRVVAKRIQRPISVV